MIAVRVGLVAIAAAAIAALAIGLHVSRLEARALALTPPGSKLTEARLREVQGLLRDAEHPNRGVEPLILQGQLTTFASRPELALGPLEQAVREEPENYEAWRQLARAAETVDPRLAARARARLQVLSPPVGGR